MRIVLDCEPRMNIGGKAVLLFQVTENHRTRKPVYLDGDIRRTFLRKGGGDYKAQMQDIERILRDATADRWDSQPFERVLLKEAFHSGSLRWYRDRFHQVNTGFDPKQPDQEFLYHWGYLLRHGKRFIPTRAAIMLFGSSLAVHQLIPRLTLDVQFHQDYGDHSRKAVIKFFRDGIQFWNPGDVFGDDSRLFEPGEKEVRNPAIAMAMRRIAMCEQAGTGMRMMREEWQKLGHPAPTYKNDRAWKAFESLYP